MDPRRDIDASGNRVVNVANPSRGHHAATKTYVDTTTLLVHYRDPKTSSEEYVRYINLRNHTAHSLVALCKISLDWDWTTEHDKNAVGPHILLEPTTSTSMLNIEAPQDLKNKSITVEYERAVIVREWYFLFNYKGKENPNDELKFVWQVSDDGHNWHIDLHNMETKMKKMKWCGNDGELVFLQPHHRDPHTYWRVHITEGNLTEQLYLNQIYMTVSL